jgi:hypothetical protein
VAVKFAEVAPDGTVTETASTPNRLLLLDNETAVPPVGTAALSATVQVVLLPLLRLVETHESELRVAPPPPPPVTVPPVAEVPIAEPEAEEAYVLLTPIEVPLTPAAIVRFTVATTPFSIAFAFIPVTRHVY